MTMKTEDSAEFSGQCAFAVSLGKKNVAGKNSVYLIQNSRKYLFSNIVAKFLWRILPSQKQKAEENWKLK